MVMCFEKFEKIMNVLIEADKKRDRISDFFEKELMDSWCIFNYGDEVESCLVNMLADEFNCWYEIPYTTAKTVKIVKNGQVTTTDSESLPKSSEWWESKYCRKENEIEDWLYRINENEDKKVTIDDKEIDITSLKDFYNYLVTYCVHEKNGFDKSED